MKLLKSIKLKYEHGDIVKISAQSGISLPTIGNAIRNSKGSRKTIEAINKFYKNV